MTDKYKSICLDCNILTQAYISLLVCQQNMAKKRKLEVNVNISPSKKIKKEMTNNFQKLILQNDYKRAQEIVADAYLRQTFKSYIHPLIKNLIHNYYCQVKYSLRGIRGIFTNSKD